jgi:hypothetical protein
VISSLTRGLHLLSIVICLIAIASFTLFALNQTSTASAHQQEVLNSIAPPAATPASVTPPKTSPAHVGSVRKAIDEVSEAVTSPFSGVTSSTTSEWTKRGASLLFALIVYGFGLGFLARFIRVGR